MTALADKLRRRIRADGPMTVAEYMAACLGDPDHGYYLRRLPFGSAGDFVTAPEVSQIFGELIGAWTIGVWEAMGAPAPFVLAELGPGRGTLMADMLRVARRRPAFVAAAEIHLVESSPLLRTLQRQTLDGLGSRIAWHQSADDLPAMPLILAANEFFDALPVRQFVRTEGGWAERMIGLGEGDALIFGLRPTTLDAVPADRRPPGVQDTAAGAVVEISPIAAATMTKIAERLARDGGAALVIDYGHEGPAVGDTLQAVRSHRFDDPLAAPGEADLTAHVDFAALADAARAGGARPRRLMTQGAFLEALGLRERAERLAGGKPDATGAAIAEAVRRLSDADEMGTMFKVLAISHPALALPLFDGGAG